MILTENQRQQLSKLVHCREEIKTSISHMELILQEYFPNEYNLAYQHWIPQILTALQNDDRWLPRGQYSIQDTIDHITDTDYGSGVNKYIK
jgi:hypothetical protein